MLSFLGGLASSLLGNAQQSSNIDRRINAQQRENERNREYNFMLARYQNQKNFEQWQRENDYNSPKSQMQRFRDAGLNPDLMMANGAQNLSASSPQMTSGAPSTPADLSNLALKPTFAQAVNNALQNANTIAVNKKTEKETEKTGAEIVSINNETEWRNVLNAKHIESENVNIQLTKSQIPINEETAKKLIQETNVLTKSLDEISQRIRESQSRQGLINEQKAHELVKKSLSRKMIEETASRIHLNYQQAESLLVNTTENMLMNRATLIQMGKQNFLLDCQAGEVKMRTLTQEEVNARKTLANLQNYEDTFKLMNHELDGVGAFSALNLATSMFGQALGGLLK